MQLIKRLMLIVVITIIFSNFNFPFKSSQENIITTSSSNKYVSYNGKLSVQDSKLVNQYGEDIQLRGFSTQNGDVKGFDFSKYSNSKSIKSMKQNGANVLRLLFLPRHYIENSKIINQIYSIIDECIKQDMYIIIDWHTIKEGDPNKYKTEAEEFFNLISNRYKDIPNIIYEICNEPNSQSAGYTVTWDMIRSYANDVINVIRANSSDSIIIVGTPDYSHQIVQIVGKTLPYENLMYALHMYPSSNFPIIDQLLIARKNNIPIFISEWGSMTNNLVDKTMANYFVKIFEYYNLSWAYFELGDDQNVTTASVVNQGMWNNTLDDNILSNSGKYIKSILNNGITEETGYGMLKYTQNYAFWQEQYRNNITKIEFKDTINDKQTNDSIISWDLSYIEGSKQVIAYLTNDNEPGKYKLTIASNGGIIAPRNSDKLFSDFENLEEIDFGTFNTNYVNSLNSFFADSPKLKIIDMSKTSFSKISNANNMFQNQKNQLDIVVKDSTEKQFIEEKAKEATIEVNVTIKKDNTVNQNNSNSQNNESSEVVSVPSTSLYGSIMIIILGIICIIVSIVVTRKLTRSNSK